VLVLRHGKLARRFAVLRSKRVTHFSVCSFGLVLCCWADIRVYTILRGQRIRPCGRIACVVHVIMLTYESMPYDARALLRRIGTHTSPTRPLLEIMILAWTRSACFYLLLPPVERLEAALTFLYSKTKHTYLTNFYINKFKCIISHPFVHHSQLGHSSYLSYTATFANSANTTKISLVCAFIPSILSF
jgi:hypothetical protein